MTKVTYAQYYLKAKYNKDAFIQTLNEVINFNIDEVPELRLLNSFAQKQAKELLDNVDNFFYTDDF